MRLSIISLLFPFTVNALSATTANVIHGTAPYIELNDIKAVDLSSLLSIDIGGVKYVSDASGAMKKVESDGTLTPLPAATPIVLTNAGDKFNSVKTLVSADTTNYVLNNTAVIPLASRKDDDGDAIISVSGNIKGEWTDKYGKPINADAAGKSDLEGIASNCLSPYTLTLTTSNNPTISTQYGAPASSRQTVYGNNKAIFTINPATKPEICFAKPFSMHYSRAQYAGPESMWDGGTTGGTGTQSDGKGFKVQSTSQSTYGKNFPTTGSDNLYFDLDIGGSATSLTWDTVTVNGITATMSNISANKVTVTLTGPRPTTAQKTTPTPITKPTLPATIELVGKDGSKEVVKYGFIIKQWFINRGSVMVAATGVGSQTEWCSKTGYTIVEVKDLTNAKGIAGGNGGTIPTNVSYPNQNSGQYNPGSNHWRYIGGGLFSEWGDMGKYLAGAGSDWISGYYWTSDNFGIYAFNVSSYLGMVRSTERSTGISGACRSQ